MLAITWVNAEDVMLSAGGQTQKVTYHLTPFTRIGKSRETESGQVVVRARREGK